MQPIAGGRRGREALVLGGAMNACIKLRLKPAVPHTLRLQRGRRCFSALARQCGLLFILIFWSLATKTTFTSPIHSPASQFIQQRLTELLFSAVQRASWCKENEARSEAKGARTGNTGRSLCCFCFFHAPGLEPGLPWIQSFQLFLSEGRRIHLDSLCSLKRVGTVSFFFS